MTWSVSSMGSWALQVNRPISDAERRMNRSVSLLEVLAKTFSSLVMIYLSTVREEASPKFVETEETSFIK